MEDDPNPNTTAAALDPATLCNGNVNDDVVSLSRTNEHRTLASVRSRPPFAPLVLETLEDFERAFELLSCPPHYPSLIRKAEENAKTSGDRKILKDALEKAVEVGGAPVEVLQVIAKLDVGGVP